MANWWPLIALWVFAAVVGAWALRRERRLATEGRAARPRGRLANRLGLAVGIATGLVLAGIGNGNSVAFIVVTAASTVALILALGYAFDRLVMRWWSGQPGRRDGNRAR